MPKTKSPLPAGQHRLSWNEIRSRATKFSKEWAGAHSENAEAQTFWNEFFDVFGLSRKRVASFEEPVKKQDGRDGRIDLLWKQVLMVEHKSLGKDLNAAVHQALDYFPGLTDQDLPQYVLVSDFARLRLHDLEGGTDFQFELKDLHKEVRRFGFMVGYQTQSYGEQDPVNVRAAERLGRLHDLLRESGYTGHKLEKLLVRLLFCLFADDTGLFERRSFQDLIEQRTSIDGADLGHWLADLFQVLDTRVEERQKKLDEDLAAFPWVNGKLFEEPLPIAAFDTEMRTALLQACGLDWSRISPAIFGSLFQSIMDKEVRRNLGAHYTSETNILKALRPLFLEDLEAEFNRVKRSRKQLAAFHQKLAKIRILDPACGCGNFLVIAYRELRMLEMDVLRALYKSRLKKGMEEGLSIDEYLLLDVDQFYGIEIEEFPAQIAQVALWLMDHQMNLLAGEEFGQLVSRLPLTKHAKIVQGNALRMDWSEVVDPSVLSYIVGNPPFVGSKFLTDEQKLDVASTFKARKGSGLLDYVSCWYVLAMNFISSNPSIRVAFVSTNSITQGEQPSALWLPLLEQGLQFHFAHRTFQWSSEGRGRATVQCVIIGFGLQDVSQRYLFQYKDPLTAPERVAVSRINPYLVDGPDVVLRSRSHPLCDSPEIGIGNKPIDGGQYLFKPDEKAEFLQSEPKAKKCFRRWYGADELLNGKERWCLWLGECPPSELRKMPHCMERIAAVRALRKASKSAPTRKLAETPTRFHVENIPDSDYLAIPEVSSERREYIPLGFLGPDTLASNLLKVMRHASLFHFGVLQSRMHMAWTRAVCGRLESRYRYSAEIVYNNFPWPDPDKKSSLAIENAAKTVLSARDVHGDATLADLYDPRTMPANLVKAHRKLDQAVDKAYGAPRFSNEAKRVAFLFELYSQIAEDALNRP